MNLLKFFLFFSVISIINRQVNLFDFLAKKSVFLNLYCTNNIPFNRRFSEVLSALICGNRLENLFDKKLFIEIGVYHFIVVSGSHLNLIEKIIQTLSFGKAKKTAVITLLFLYCLISLFQPPVVRAFTALLLMIANKKFRFFKTHSLLILFCSAFVLSLCPEWLQSLSFLLSWACLLNILLAQQIIELIKIITIKDLFHKYLAPIISVFLQMFLYTVLFLNPAYFSFSAFISYLVLSPILALVVFPVCLFCYFLLFLFQQNSFSILVFEKVGNITLDFFEFFHHWIGNANFSLKNNNYLWFLLWIFYLHAFLFYLEIKKQRTKVFNLTKALT